MKTHRETGDDRDNRRVYVWGACAAVLILALALLFLYAVDRRGEAPMQPAENATQGAPASPPGAGAVGGSAGSR